VAVGLGIGACLDVGCGECDVALPELKETKKNRKFRFIWRYRGRVDDWRRAW
jgi:hypothetical protein